MKDHGSPPGKGGVRHQIPADHVPEPAGDDPISGQRYHPLPGLYTEMTELKGVQTTRLPDGMRLLAQYPPALLCGVEGLDQEIIDSLVLRLPLAALQRLVPPVADSGAQQHIAALLQRRADAASALVLWRVCLARRDGDAAALLTELATACELRAHPDILTALLAGLQHIPLRSADLAPHLPQLLSLQIQYTAPAVQLLSADLLKRITPADMLAQWRQASGEIREQIWRLLLAHDPDLGDFCLQQAEQGNLALTQLLPWVHLPAVRQWLLTQLRSSAPVQDINLAAWMLTTELSDPEVSTLLPRLLPSAEQLFSVLGLLTLDVLLRRLRVLRALDEMCTCACLQNALAAATPSEQRRCAPLLPTAEEDLLSALLVPVHHQGEIPAPWLPDAQTLRQALDGLTVIYHQAGLRPPDWNLLRLHR